LSTGWLTCLGGTDKSFRQEFSTKDWDHPHPLPWIHAAPSPLPSSRGNPFLGTENVSSGETAYAPRGSTSDCPFVPSKMACNSNDQRFPDYGKKFLCTAN